MNPSTNAIDSNVHASADRDAPIGKNGSASSQVKTVLNDAMLARFASRAASYDQENGFFQEDFEDLGPRAICYCQYLRSSAAPA